MMDQIERGHAAKLTDGQKACLRLVLAHREIKEIARELHISPDTVKKRLEVARRVLGVSRSIDAAQMLEAEESAPYPRRVYLSEPLPSRSETTFDRLTEQPGELASPDTVREQMIAYQPHASWSGRRRFPWPFPTAKRPLNDLTTAEILLAACLAVPCAAAFAIGILAISGELIAVGLAMQAHIERLINALL